jgi:hypothetical protein
VGDERGDVGQLGLFGAQELAARGDVEKQVAHGDGGAGQADAFADGQDAPAGDLHARAGGLFRRAGLDDHAGDAGDGRQGLAAEPQRGDGFQLLDARDLRGGVPLQRKQRIVTQHTAAVVGDADQAPAAAFGFHADVVSAGVERVLEQLLHHGSRTFDHLSGGDLVGDLVAENVDAAHAEKGGRRERARLSILGVLRAQSMTMPRSSNSVPSRC